jgi:hypothetical protein
MRVRRGLAVGVVLVALLGARAARAGDWLPHPADATWTYSWSDTQYVKTPIKEKTTVGDQKGSSFTLHWTTADLDNPADSIASTGDVQFQDTPAGVINTNWSSTPPPPDFPVLCPTLACSNTLSSTWYYLIWGGRSPVIQEPLLQHDEWTSTGGAQGDVSSASRYAGQEQVVVPAFPGPVTAAKVVSTITQAGALGDPYGSGTRTVWWVYGVGPVKMTFVHAGGAGAPVTTAVLESTNQAPKSLPDDANYFPLVLGKTLTYSSWNSKHMAKPEVEQFTIDSAAQASARFTVKSRSGPMKVTGSYGFSTRADGVTNLWGNTQAATRLQFPPLGPSELPVAKRRHFFTPFDLMTFGFNPLLPAYATVGATWSSSRDTQDWLNYGVAGSTTITGVQTVKVKAGTYRALVVRSTLTQAGFRFGSGSRTCWFAPDVGLVKLVFRHGDGSVTTVELVSTSS